MDITCVYEHSIRVLVSMICVGEYNICVGEYGMR